MFIATALLKPFFEVVISIPLPHTVLGTFALSFVVSAAVAATVSMLVLNALDSVDSVEIP